MSPSHNQGEARHDYRGRQRFARLFGGRMSDILIGAVCFILGVVVCHVGLFG